MSPHPDSDSASGSDPSCPFCTIIKTHPPSSPLDTNNTDTLANNDSDLDTDSKAYVILSTPSVIAFLDIYPLTRGHVLCCPRRHVSRMGDLTAAEGRDLGAVLPLLSRALARAVMPDLTSTTPTGSGAGGDGPDYNILQNNGPGAAQVVPHVHFHWVPRYPLDYRVVEPHPILTSTAAAGAAAGKTLVHAPVPSGFEASRIMFGRGQRHYRDEEESEGLAEIMRRCIREEWEWEFGSSSSSLASSTGTGTTDPRARSKSRSRL